ncbi:Os06g0493000 protein, related [Eimeria necatrix]|uniref:Os06g0493000 protein, related n=1 Tax=Eimeria necatrix TaxID=51315 RepID=U6MN06_9EIME|nr:Os06g0493000 protein, related [Eimeria necatrix]CDJ64468.1 Os06g0493000 protein, related [Eimeria necatrix]
MTKLFRQLCNRAQSHILKAKCKQKYYADTRRRAVEYAGDDKVWLSSKHLPASTSCPKFEPCYRGPFQVTERIKTVAYRLALPPTCECHDVFRVSQLVSHCPNSPVSAPQEADAGWLPVLDADSNPQEEYELDYIMDQPCSGADAQYLVK